MEANATSSLPDLMSVEGLLALEAEDASLAVHSPAEEDATAPDLPDLVSLEVHEARTMPSPMRIRAAILPLIDVEGLHALEAEEASAALALHPPAEAEETAIASDLPDLMPLEEHDTRSYLAKDDTLSALAWNDGLDGEYSALVAPLLRLGYVPPLSGS